MITMQTIAAIGLIYLVGINLAGFVNVKSCALAN